MKKYVWLNIDTGEFSNSWDYQKDFPTSILVKKVVDEEIERLKNDQKSKWKLIEYSCPNDEDFVFYNMMKITTNLKPKNKSQ